MQYQRSLCHHRKPDGSRLGTRTQALRLGIVQGLFAWLAKEDRLDANPAAALELPRFQRQPPKAVLTAKEAELILMQADVRDPMGLRARAMLEVFYSTGVRPMELIGLSIYDVDPGRGCITVRRGKGGRGRTIPIGERALLWVQK